jgi:hypothetical protein
MWPCLNNFSYLWGVYSFSSHRHPDLWSKSCGITNLKQELSTFPFAAFVTLLSRWDRLMQRMIWIEETAFGISETICFMSSLCDVKTCTGDGVFSHSAHVVFLEIPNKFRWYLVLTMYIKCFTVIWFRFTSVSVNLPLPETQLQQTFYWGNCLIRRKT